jgi:hypothetical protein
MFVDAVHRDQEPGGLGHSAPLNVRSRAAIPEPTKTAFKPRFGTKGVVDMTKIVGYYTFLAMQLNVAQYQVETDGKKLPRMPR